MHQMNIRFLLFYCLTISHLAANPVRELAPDYIVFAESPDPATIPLRNPSIIRLDSGKLVGTYMVSDKFNDSIQSATRVKTSDDHGLTWTLRLEIDIGQARLFTAGDSIYLLGSGGTMKIHRSADDSTTWSKSPATLAKGPWHQTAANFIHHNHHVYLATEKRIGKEIDAWYPGELAPILMRAKESDDLTKPESWKYSSVLPFKDFHRVKNFRELVY